MQVPSGLYPNRPPGTFCWLKAAAIPLRGSTCDNGKFGCVSGVVDGRGNGSNSGGGYKPDLQWQPSYVAGSNESLPSGVSSCAVGGGMVFVGQRGAGVEPILVLNAEGKAVRGFGIDEVRLSLCGGHWLDRCNVLCWCVMYHCIVFPIYQ